MQVKGVKKVVVVPWIRGKNKKPETWIVQFGSGTNTVGEWTTKEEAKTIAKQIAEAIGVEVEEVE